MSFEDDLENQCQARLLNEYYRQEFKEYIDDDDEVHWKPVAKRHSEDYNNETSCFLPLIENIRQKQL